MGELLHVKCISWQALQEILFCQACAFLKTLTQRLSILQVCCLLGNLK